MQMVLLLSQINKVLLLHFLILNLSMNLFFNIKPFSKSKSVIITLLEFYVKLLMKFNILKQLYKKYSSDKFCQRIDDFIKYEYCWI